MKTRDSRMICRMGYLVLPLVLSASLLSNAQSTAKPSTTSQSTPPQPPPTFTLAAVTENPNPAPAFGAIGNVQCDGLRNVYFNVTLQSNSPKSILRISADGKGFKQLFLPSDFAKYYLSAFYVDQGGTLFALLMTNDPPFTYTVIELSSTGEELRRTALQLHGDFSPTEFAVLPDGKIMVRGSMSLPPEPTPKGKIPVDRAFLYMAWLDANGQVVHDTGSDPKGRDVFDSSTHEDFAAITPGLPGTFLTVSNTSLNTYDGSGALLHSFPIAKPQKDAIASSIQYLDGQAEIKFQVPHVVDLYPPAPEDGPHPLTPNPNPPRQQTVTVFRQVWLFADPETGTMNGFYQLPDFHGAGDCYLGSQNFLYSTVKSTRHFFVEAQSK